MRGRFSFWGEKREKKQLTLVWFGRYPLHTWRQVSGNGNSAKCGAQSRCTAEIIQTVAEERKKDKNSNFGL